jgi:hypothetical protein
MSGTALAKRSAVGPSLPLVSVPAAAGAARRGRVLGGLALGQVLAFAHRASVAGSPLSCWEPAGAGTGSVVQHTAEAALTRVERLERLEEVSEPELGPELGAEEELGVGGPPQQKVADALVAAGADQEVHRADRGRGEPGFQQRLVHGLGGEAPGGHVPRDLGGRIGQLFLAPVREGQREGHAGEVGAVPLERVQHVQHTLGQLVDPADGAQADLVVHELGALRHQVLDEQLHEGGHLVLGALPVLLAEGVEREGLHPGAAALTDDVPHRVAALVVPCGSHAPPARCPAPVPIHDDGDVMGRCVERGCHGVEEGVARRGHTLCGQRNVTYHGAIPASSEGAGTWWLS